MLIDTHCHLHDREWYTPEEMETCLAGAQAAGVEKVICIGTDPEDSRAAAEFAAQHAGVFWTYGIHPEWAGKWDGTEADRWIGEWGRAEAGEWGRTGARVASLAPKSAKRRPVAIGEVGLDYHYEGYDRAAQLKLFERMLQLARDEQLPVSLHIRAAFEDALGVLANFPELTGVVHSFTGSKKVLKQVLSRGFYVGVNGLATYSTLPLPPLEKMLLETDAPFLTPIPNRGTMNKPEYVRDIAAYLADKLGVAENVIAEQTTKNAEELFGI